MLKTNHFVWITVLALMSLGEDLRGGRFLTPTTYPTGQLPVAAVLRDLNHDGVMDLATAKQNGNNISATAIPISSLVAIHALFSEMATALFRQDSSSPLPMASWPPATLMATATSICLQPGTS
jgi:hypothetical protein